MHSVTDAAGATCACWAGAFVLGSVPLGYLIDRRRLRRDIRRLSRGADLRVLLTGRDSSVPSTGEIVGAIADIVKVVGLSVLALVIVRHFSPGFGRGRLPAESAFGAVGVRVLTFWQSAAVWAGAAAAFGHLNPAWRRARSAGQGQAPLVALAIRYAPAPFVVAVGGFVVAIALTRRQGAAVAVSLAGFVGMAWAQWVWSLPHWWGYLPGPEMALWAAAMAALAGVAARAEVSPRS